MTRKLLFAAALLIPSQVFAAASLNDQAILAADLLFKNRVRESLAATAIAVTTEATSTAFHFRRVQFAVQVMLALQTNTDLTSQVVVAVATDANVIGDATAGGTVPLTSGNADTQQALVTDAHINSAISGQFNSYFNPW